MPIRARLYVSAHQGQVICQCPSGPAYLSVPIRARLCQCPSGPIYLSVPIRARLLCQCPAGPVYLSVPSRASLSVSAQQGQVIISMPNRARLLCQCPAGPGYYVSAQQGKQRGWCGIPQGNSIHCCVSAPHQSTNRGSIFHTDAQAGPLVKP